MNITRNHRARTSDRSKLLVIGTWRAALDGPVLVMDKRALIEDLKECGL
jgi:hypothetical protein